MQACAITCTFRFIFVTVKFTQLRATSPEACHNYLQQTVASPKGPKDPNMEHVGSPY